MLISETRKAKKMKKYLLVMLVVTLGLILIRPRQAIPEQGWEITAVDIEGQRLEVSPGEPEDLAEGSREGQEALAERVSRTQGKRRQTIFVSGIRLAHANRFGPLT